MEILNHQRVSTWKTRGRHFYQFYKGREDLFGIVIPFLSLGLESHEACFWIVSNSVGVLEATHAFGRQCDLAPYLDKGQLLIFPAEKWYLNGGRFSERTVFRKLEKFVEDKKQRGFLTYRGVTDLAWLEPPDWLSFHSYEKKIHDRLQDFQMTVICAYPIQRCTLTQTQDILSHHDSVFLSKLQAARRLLSVLQ